MFCIISFPGRFNISLLRDLCNAAELRHESESEFKMRPISNVKFPRLALDKSNRKNLCAFRLYQNMNVSYKSRIKRDLLRRRFFERGLKYFEQSPTTSCRFCAPVSYVFQSMVFAQIFIALLKVLFRLLLFSWTWTYNKLNDWLI